MAERGWRGAGAERVWRLGLRGGRGQRGNRRVVPRAGLPAAATRARPRRRGAAGWRRLPGNREDRAGLAGRAVPSGSAGARCPRRAACGDSPRRGSRGLWLSVRSCGRSPLLSSQPSPGGWGGRTMCVLTLGFLAGSRVCTVLTLRFTVWDACHIHPPPLQAVSDLTLCVEILAVFNIPVNLL